MKTKPTSTGPKADLYAPVTDRLVTQMQQGVRPWMRPWTATGNPDPMGRPLRHNGTPYRGINVVLLWCEAIDKGFRSPTWMTYKQAQEFGGQVRKGESGSMVVYADRYTKTETNERGEDAERNIAFLKAYTVFNLQQNDGLPEKYQVAPSPVLEPVPLIAAAEAFANTGAIVRHGGDRAFYSPANDFIELPPAGAFHDAESYAATMAHELVHWTGHESREARVFGKRFGDDAYAFEELVAEIGAAFLCADLGITPEVREDHAAYLSHWLDVLKQDRRAIFTAAAHAQRAADFLHGLQGAPA